MKYAIPLGDASLTLFLPLSLRRKLHIRARYYHLTELPEQLSFELRMRLDFEYLSRQQD